MSPSVIAVHIRSAASLPLVAPSSVPAGRLSSAGSSEAIVMSGASHRAAELGSSKREMRLSSLRMIQSQSHYSREGENEQNARRFSVSCRCVALPVPFAALFWRRGDE